MADLDVSTAAGLRQMPPADIRSGCCNANISPPNGDMSRRQVRLFWYGRKPSDLTNVLPANDQLVLNVGKPLTAAPGRLAEADALMAGR